ncbi:hypothetical protein SAMN02745163_02537 [Clostridium cavendishii DSM 21758]|uniref:Uncharacterized protein n=1 Tax=Clostridium cavendishii DSM 21758 TaxID=1121302 RepID=A0A1M6LYJ5_9CLOT|nr:hypothetical protein [Clostridium cavendishii]SHJ76298.1 hypothetical protein SAMN02745163_02537 [Clostridium cavendishii DSM 21758]
MEKVKNKFKNNILIKISFTSLIIIAALLSCYFIFFNQSKDLRAMNDIAKTISSSNLSLNESVKDSIIDNIKSVNLLKKNKETLINAKNNLKAIKPSKKYSNLYQNLNLALDNNIRLYDQTVSMLSNPTSNDLSSAFENFNSIKNDCLVYYKLCEKSGIQVYLENDSKPFFSKIFTYLNTILKVNRDHDINNSQKNTFLLSIDKCIMEFSKLNSDFSPAIDKAKNENRSFKDILSSVNDKTITLNSIKSNYYSLTVPNDALDCFNSFGDMISIYDIYLSELSLGLNSNDKVDPNTNAHLDNAFSKYKDLKTALNKFNESYEAYKNSK